MGRDGQGDPPVAPGQGFDRQRHPHRVEAGPAVVGGDDHSPEAQPRQFRDQLLGKGALGVPTAGLDPQFAGGELAGRLPDQPLLVGVFEPHGPTPAKEKPLMSLP